jgi:Fe2+ or Zn2+ uptake regulation protein
VAEADADAVFAAIHSCTDRAGFMIKGAVVEVQGLCANCGAEEREPAHGSA